MKIEIKSYLVAIGLIAYVVYVDLLFNKIKGRIIEPIDDNLPQMQNNSKTHEFGLLQLNSEQTTYDLVNIFKKCSNAAHLEAELAELRKFKAKMESMAAVQYAVFKNLSDNAYQ